MVSASSTPPPPLFFLLLHIVYVKQDTEAHCCYGIDMNLKGRHLNCFNYPSCSDSCESQMGNYYLFCVIITV